MQRAVPSTVLERQRLLSTGDVIGASTPEQHGVDKPNWPSEDVDRGTTSSKRWTPTRLLEAYSEALEEKPLLVKCISSGILGALSDLITQCIFWGQTGDAVWHDTEAVRQTVAVILDGVLVSAPVLHCRYGALDRWIPAEEQMSYAIIQVVVDVCVIDTVYALIFMFTTGFFEGKSLEGYIIPAVKADYLDLVCSLVVVGVLIAPFQVYLFNGFPVKWRVLISDSIDVLWDVIAIYSIGPAS